MKYIATYDGCAGVGPSLEDAFDNLCDQDSTAKEDREAVQFFEAVAIAVDFKIIKRSVPVKTATTVNRT